MSRRDKLLRRLQAQPTPTDITWDEISLVLKHFGYELKKGAGSRRKFIHGTSGHVISLHEPHPQPHVKSYCVRQVVDVLTEIGFMKNGGNEL